MQTEQLSCGAAWLNSAGLRPTRQRVALAALLVGDGQNRHVTADSLFDAARRAGADLSLSTVYNTLAAFSEAGLIKEIAVDGGRLYYDTRLDDHPHFYWEDTATLTDAPQGGLTIENLPAAPQGMRIARVDVVVHLRRG